MSDDLWRARLAEAIQVSGKSARAVSTEAGLGVGYVHSILKEGKDPTIERLVAVCDAIPVSLIYVLYGVDAEPDDIEILKLLQENPSARRGILAILGKSS
jgi:lambda repressor-like predicted transcriptional regulator